MAGPRRDRLQRRAIKDGRLARLAVHLQQRALVQQRANVPRLEGEHLVEGRHFLARALQFAQHRGGVEPQGNIRRRRLHGLRKQRVGADRIAGRQHPSRFLALCGGVPGRTASAPCGRCRR